jgi:hypothetical protein
VPPQFTPADRSGRRPARAKYWHAALSSRSPWPIPDHGDELGLAGLALCRSVSANCDSPGFPALLSWKRLDLALGDQPEAACRAQKEQSISHVARRKQTQSLERGALEACKQSIRIEQDQMARRLESAPVLAIGAVARGVNIGRLEPNVPPRPQNAPTVTECLDGIVKVLNYVTECDDIEEFIEVRTEVRKPSPQNLAAAQTRGGRCGLIHFNTVAEPAQPASDSQEMAVTATNVKQPLRCRLHLSYTPIFSPKVICQSRKERHQERPDRKRRLEACSKDSVSVAIGQGVLDARQGAPLAIRHGRVCEVVSIGEMNGCAVRARIEIQSPAALTAPQGPNARRASV